MHVGHALQHFFYAVLLQRAHTLVQRRREHVGYAGALLDQLLDRIGTEQELVQPDPAFVTGAAARLAANRRVERELALVVGKSLGPFTIDGLVRSLGITLPGIGRLELLAI